jgi:hypothetical protein
MSRDKAQALATNRFLAHAIKAVHDKFKKALMAEWDIRGDSAEIRNAMHPLRNRCQQCKKPAAGIGDICECRTKTKFERCLSNPRNTLLELLLGRCQSVSSSVTLAKFVEQITRIGVANGRDLNWVKGQIHGLRPLLSRTCRKWIVGVCPSPFNHTGLLPAWPKDDGVILEAELHRSMSAEDSEAEFVLIEAQLAECFEEAKKEALDQANIQMAQVVRLVPENTRRQRARQDIIAAMIAKIKRDNPKWSIERICRQLDVRECPRRAKDTDAGSSWHDLWKNPQHRNRIKRFISQIQPAAPEKKV